MLARLEAAGYVRPIASADRGAGRQRALTEHAREWIESLWGPIRDDGARLLEQFSTRDLAAFARFLKVGSTLQERHAARIRALAEFPASNRPRAIRALTCGAAARPALRAGPSRRAHHARGSRRSCRGQPLPLRAGVPYLYR